MSHSLFDDSEEYNSDRFAPKSGIGLVGWLLLSTLAGLALIGVSVLVGRVFPPEEQNQVKENKGVIQKRLNSIGRATHDFHDNHNHLPPNYHRSLPDHPAKSFHAGLLPFMDQEHLNRTIDFQRTWDDPVNRAAYSTTVTSFLSPTYTRALTDAGYAPTHFVPSSRVYGIGQDGPLKLSDIRDGLSNTILAGSIDMGFPAWGDPNNGRDPAHGFAGGPTAFGGERGAWTLFADGSVRLMAKDTSADVAMMLASVDGREHYDRQAKAVYFPDRNRARQKNGGYPVRIGSKPDERNGRVDLAKDDLAELQAVNQQLQAQTKNLEAQLSQFRRYPSTIQDLERSQIQFKRQLEQATTRLAEAGKQTDYYRKELDRIVSERKDDIAYYNEEIARLASERARLAERLRWLERAEGETAQSSPDSDKEQPTTTDNSPDSESKPAEVSDAIQDDLKALGLAAMNFQDTYGHLPPLAPGDKSTKVKPMSWHTWLLPFINQSILFDNIDKDRVWTDPKNTKAFQVKVPGFLHDGNESEPDPSGYGVTHYVPNRQLMDKSGSGIGLGKINDGTSFTVMAGTIDGTPPAWGDPNNARDFASGVAGGPKAFGLNGQGAMVLMSDGSVRMVSSATDAKVIQAIASPTGGELVGQDDF